MRCAALRCGRIVGQCTSGMAGMCGQLQLMGPMPMRARVVVGVAPPESKQNQGQIIVYTSGSGSGWEVQAMIGACMVRHSYFPSFLGWFQAARIVVEGTCKALAGTGKFGFGFVRWFQWGARCRGCRAMAEVAAAMAL